MSHPSRWSGLDGAKFLCILFMVFIHATFWLVTDQDEVMNTRSFLYPIINHTTFLGLFPLSLPITAGCGLRFYLEKIRTHTDWESFRLLPLLKISIGIMLLGYVMTLLTWGGGHAFEWDVLHFVGLSYLVIALALKVTTVPVFAVLGFFSFLLTDIVRQLVGANPGFLGAVLVGDQSGDFFWPFFPWFSTVVFGFVLAHCYIRFGKSSRFQWGLGLIALLGLGFAYTNQDLALVLDPQFVWGPGVFQPPLGFIVGLMGFFSLLLLIFDGLNAYWPPSPNGVVRSFSQGILWIYLAHIIVGARLAQLYVKWIPLSLWTVLLFAFLMILFSWFVGRLSVRLAEKQLRITLVKVKN